TKGGHDIEWPGDQLNEMPSRLQDPHANLEAQAEVRPRELEQSVLELRALGEVSQVVNSTLNLENVLATIVAQAVQLSSTTGGSIYVFDEQQEKFELRATYGMDPATVAAFAGRPVDTGERNVGLALARQEPVQIADFHDVPAS